MPSRYGTPSTETLSELVRERLHRVTATSRLLVPDGRRDAAGSALFWAVVAAVVVLGYLQGAVPVAVATPAVLGVGTLVVLQAVLTCLTVSGLFSASTLALFGQVGRAGDGRRQTGGPPVRAVVPVYRDAEALHRSVESLLASRYRDLQVVVVAEPDDTASIARAREYADHERVELLVNTRYPGSKAGAVNYAAEVTDEPYLAVFDADERVDPAFLPSAVPALSDHDVVQGRTVPEPDGVVETVAYYESVVLGDLSQRLLTLVTDFAMAASRTVLMRRAAFEAVGGYDTTMLTEDYDFAFACYLADLDVAEQFAHPSRIEAAHTPTDWWGQRKRWMTGYVQVLHGLVADCRSPESYRTLLAPLICAGSVLGNLFMLSLVSKAAVLVHNGATMWLALPLVTLTAAALTMRLYDAAVGAVDSVGVGWLVTPAILPLYSLAGIKAAVEYVLTWEGEWYSVAKGTGS